jgi:hypothetical protein
MTQRDWSKLAQAVTDAAASVQDTTIKQIVNGLARDRPNSANRGEAGLRVADRLGVHSYWRRAATDDQGVPARWLEAQADARRRSQLGILSATALPTISGLNAEQQIILLSLCALLGASPNLK